MRTRDLPADAATLRRLAVEAEADPRAVDAYFMGTRFARFLPHFAEPPPSYASIRGCHE